MLLLDQGVQLASSATDENQPRAHVQVCTTKFNQNIGRIVEFVPVEIWKLFLQLIMTLAWSREKAWEYIFLKAKVHSIPLEDPLSRPFRSGGHNYWQNMAASME